jgi:hypothetical protein
LGVLGKISDGRLRTKGKPLAAEMSADEAADDTVAAPLKAYEEGDPNPQAFRGFAVAAQLK